MCYQCIRKISLFAIYVLYKKKIITAFDKMQRGIKMTFQFSSIKVFYGTNNAIQKNINYCIISFLRILKRMLILRTIHKKLTTRSSSYIILSHSLVGSVATFLFFFFELVHNPSLQKSRALEKFLFLSRTGFLRAFMTPHHIVLPSMFILYSLVLLNSCAYLYIVSNCFHLRCYFLKKAVKLLKFISIAI